MKNSEISHCKCENEFLINKVNHKVECDYCPLINKMCIHINMILCYGCNDYLKLNTFHTLLVKWNTIIEYLEVFDAQSSV
jgi:hypothetical protein